MRLLLTVLGAVFLLPGFHARADEARRPIVDPFSLRHGATFAIVSGQVGSAGLAPGSIFVIRGVWLGPEELVEAPPSPGPRLPDAPGGTQVIFRSLETGDVFEASLLHSWMFQVGGIVPSELPLGAAEAAVRHEGRESEPVKFQAVASNPGIFSLSQRGGGPGAVQNYESADSQPINGLTAPGRPGQYLILWATGLGLAADSENFEVDIGGTLRLKPEYAGPAPGLPGVDQINIRLPENPSGLPEGCYVPVSLGAGDSWSTSGTIALSRSSSTCSHPWGLSPQRLAEIDGGGFAKTLHFGISQQVSPLFVNPAINPGSPGERAWFAMASARLGRAGPLGLAELSPHQASGGIGGGRWFETDTFLPNCSDPTIGRRPLSAIIPAGPDDPDAPQPPTPEPLVLPADAGTPLAVTGPAGQIIELAASEFAPHDHRFTAAQFEPVLEPGIWRLNAPGGTDVGPLDIELRVPAPLKIDFPALVRRSGDIEFSWPVEDYEGWAMAHFWVRTESPQEGSATPFQAVSCSVWAQTGSLRIPAKDLANLLRAPTVAVRIGFTVEVDQADVDTASRLGLDRVSLSASVGEERTIPVE